MVQDRTKNPHHTRPIIRRENRACSRRPIAHETSLSGNWTSRTKSRRRSPRNRHRLARQKQRRLPRNQHLQTQGELQTAPWKIALPSWNSWWKNSQPRMTNSDRQSLRPYRGNGLRRMMVQAPLLIARISPTWNLRMLNFQIFRFSICG